MRLQRIEILANILFWGLMTWIFVFGNATMDIQGIEMIEGKEHKTFVRNYDKVYASIVAQFFCFVFFYIELYLIFRLKTPKAVGRFVLKSVGLIFGTLFLYIILLKSIFLPEVEGLDSGNTIILMIVFYTAVVICYGFTKKWIKHERDNKQLELVKNQAELNLLRQQLQPHFLFNTMNNLLAMVNQKDNPKLARGIDKLSSLLRYLVYDTNNKRVSIAQEIAFLRNFIELHLLRFEEDEINFSLKVNGHFDQQPIEPGIFLCYIENAFKHGMQPEEVAFIAIHIDLSQAHQIVFKIENSIPAHPFNNEKGGFGILANQERLDLVYPDQHSITSESGDTYKVELILNTK